MIPGYIYRYTEYWRTVNPEILYGTLRHRKNGDIFLEVAG